jgi:hypothetical protein
VSEAPAAGTPPDGSRWASVFATGGEMGATIAAHDWSTTPLGPIEGWPQSLRTAVTICLHSRFPILLWWGDELVMLYNDAYLPILGASKRHALSRPGAQVWPEVWDVIGPMLTGVLAGEGATWSQDQLLLLDRDGFVEECYFTFSYSPIIDESGTPGGVFTAVTETTDRVVGDRRLRLLGALAAGLVDVAEPDEVCRRAVKLLAGNPDVPFVRLHRAEPGGLRLVAGTETAAPAGAERSWPLAEVLTTGETRLLPLDPADDPSRPGTPMVAVVPVPEPGEAAPGAVLVAGLNPRRPVDADYRSFIELLAGHVGTALAGARAYQAAVPVGTGGAGAAALVAELGQPDGPGPEPVGPHLPVVLLSARAGPEAAVEGLTAGADDYLVKPFAADELLARVRASSSPGPGPGCAAPSGPSR